MFNHVSTFAKRHVALITITIILLILIAIFHEIMQPFIIALIVVYLIDPFVALVHKINIKGHHLPRGVAVISAYLIFFGAVTGICFALIPSLTKEISAATEAMPQYYNQIKNEELPKWNHKLDELIFELSRKNNNDIEASVQDTSTLVDNAFDNAMQQVAELNIPIIDTTGAKPLLQAERAIKPKIQNTEIAQEFKKTPVLFTLHQTEDGYYEFRQGSDEIIIQPNEKGAYTIKTVNTNETQKQDSIFNLEQEITKSISEFIESSTEYIGNALSFLQYLIEFIVDTFIQVILVFMLAAFISIDSPKLMTSVRSLFEDAKGKASYFDEYKEKLSKALSGVIRGQMIICLINGTLTGIALFAFNIEYALLLGIIAGVLSIVPVFGTIISTIPCVLLALMQSWWQAIGVLASILIIHLIDTNVFTPKIIGASTNLHPAVIIFAILAGQHVAGALGLVLALPITAIAITTVKFFLDHAKKSDVEAEKQNHLALAMTTAPASSTLPIANPPITQSIPVSGIAQALSIPSGADLSQPLPLVSPTPVQPKSVVQPQNIQPQNIQPQNIQPQNIQPQNIQSQNIQSQNIQPQISHAQSKQVKDSGAPLPVWIPPQDQVCASAPNSSNTSTSNQQSVKASVVPPVTVPENAKDTDTILMQDVDHEVFTDLDAPVDQTHVIPASNHKSRQIIIHKGNK